MIPMFLDYRYMVGITFTNSTKFTIYASALMLMEDILIDETNIDVSNIHILFDTPYEYTSTNKLENSMRNLLLQSRKECSEKQLQLLYDLHNTQTKTTDLNNFDKLVELSKAKGYWFPSIGYSYNPHTKQDEIEALALLGYWIKCIDDEVDLEEDLEHGISTIYTHPASTFIPKQHIEKLRKKVFDSIKLLPYSNTKKKVFLYRISIATYTFKLHNELLKKMPNWYQNLLNKFQPLMFFNVVLASVLGIQKLYKIK
jgi:hypothetical protein